MQNETFQEMNVRDFQKIINSLNDRCVVVNYESNIIKINHIYIEESVFVFNNGILGIRNTDDELNRITFDMQDENYIIECYNDDKHIYIHIKTIQKETLIIEYEDLSNN